MKFPHLDAKSLLQNINAEKFKNKVHEKKKKNTQVRERKLSADGWMDTHTVEHNILPLSCGGTIIIKALTALVSQLSLSVGWENSLELRLNHVSFNP